MSFIGKIGMFFVTVMVAFLALAMFFEFDVVGRQPGETFTVLRGQNAFQIANDLRAEGYIKSKIFFLANVIAGGHLRELKAGDYDLGGAAQSEIIDKLVTARTVAADATIIPGWNIAEIAGSLARGRIIGGDDFYAAVGTVAVLEREKEYDFLESLPENADLEGFLAPDTYELPNEAKAGDLVTLALDNFDVHLTEKMRGDIAARDLTVFDVVTMAAMLEKEVRTLEDKKLVSGLLWKRLEAGMPLQVDSTLLYYKLSGADSGVIDKESDSLYNTYRYAGMPVGPICNPGLESIEAAIYPIESDYWYYLNARDGTTIFSRNYGEHLINKAKYIDNL